jgi:ribonucleotide monophosphatase NagD (HAD superfamily)
MVGDDAVADVAAAMDVGLQGCLVRTGKFQPGDEKHIPDTGNVIDSIADLSDLVLSTQP